MSYSVLYNFPNLLTFARIAAIPAISLCLYTDTTGKGRIYALILFAIAGITDFLDGWLARKWKLQSAFGRMLDPIADKLLVAVMLIMLTHDFTISGLNVFAAVIILCREILVSGLREYLAAASVSLPVTQAAKWKTAVQMGAIGFLTIDDAANAFFPFTHQTGVLLLWVSAILTVVTGYDYLRSGIAHAVEERGD